MLDASEVTDTEYICNGDPGQDGGSVLIDLEVEPPGANCANGGTAVHAGLDSNENGVLDASEISSTSYVCDGGSTGGISGVLEGSYTIRNSLDASMIQGITSITGDLVVEAPGLTALSLPQLTNIGGVLAIQNNTALQHANGLSALTSIGGNLLVYNNDGLTTVVLSSLTTVEALRVLFVR